MTRDTVTEPFEPNRAGLDLGTELLLDPPPQAALPDLTAAPVGPEQALRDLAGAVLTGARHLDDPGFFAHMDPVTPWVTWVAAQWAARLNQNLLHLDTGAVARDLEDRVMQVLAPLWVWTGATSCPALLLPTSPRCGPHVISAISPPLSPLTRPLFR